MDAIFLPLLPFLRQTPPVNTLTLWANLEGTLFVQLPGQSPTRIVTGASGGDMLKSVYDPQNAGYISGESVGEFHGGVLSFDASAGGRGGGISMYAGDNADAGDINTSGGSSPGANGGAISTFGTTEAGGSINTSGEGHAGGNIDTHGGSDDDGGSISTANGGGSIDTLAGTIGLGVNGGRVILARAVGAEGNVTVTLPYRTGLVLVAGNDGTEGQFLKMVSGVPTWSDLP